MNGAARRWRFSGLSAFSIFAKDRSALSCSDARREGASPQVPGEAENGQRPTRLDARRLAGSAEAFDRAVADYYGLTGDPVGILKQAVERDPAFALGGVAIAALYLIGGFRGDHPEVTNALAAAEAAIGGASSRERRHLAAAKAWAAGRTFEATLVWEDILVDHPTDALALRFAEDAYFFLGQSSAFAISPRGFCRPGIATTP